MMSKRSVSACQRSRNPRLVCSHMDLRHAVRTAVADCMRELITEEDTLRQLRERIKARSAKRYNSAIIRQPLLVCSDSTQTINVNQTGAGGVDVNPHSHEENNQKKTSNDVSNIRRHCPAAPTPISMLCDELMQEDQLTNREQPQVNGQGSWMQWRSGTPFTVRDRDMKRFRHWQNPHKPSPPPTPDGVNKFRSGPPARNTFVRERPRSAQILRRGDNENEESVEFIHSNGLDVKTKPNNSGLGHSTPVAQNSQNFSLKRRPASAEPLDRNRNGSSHRWLNNQYATLNHMKSWIESAAPEDREVLLQVMHTLEKDKKPPSGLEQYSSLKPTGNQHALHGRFYNHWDNSPYYVHNAPTFNAIPSKQHYKWNPSLGSHQMIYNGDTVKKATFTVRDRPPQHYNPHTRPNILRIKHEQVQTSPRTDELTSSNRVQLFGWKSGQLSPGVVQTNPGQMKNLFC